MAKSEVTKLDRAEEGVGKGELVSPLAYEGRKGGNPLSPEATGYSPNPDTHGTEVIEPKDPMGLLDTLGENPKSRGKRGGAY